MCSSDLTRAYLRVLAGRREDPGEILTRVNGVLAEDIGNERFVTLFLGRLDPATKALIYASAGHPTGYLLNAKGDIKTTLPRTGVPLGIRPDTQYTSSAEITLASGDLLLLLTDGITEATTSEDVQFGPDRALDYVRAHRQDSAQQIAEGICQAARCFAGGEHQLDDLTSVVVKVD